MTKCCVTGPVLSDILQALWSIKMVGTAHPMTQHHIPRDGLLINTATRTSYLTDCHLLSFMLCSNPELHLCVTVIPLCVVEITFKFTSFKQHTYQNTMNTMGHVLWLPPIATISKYMKFIQVNFNYSSA